MCFKRKTNFSSAMKIIDFHTHLQTHWFQKPLLSETEFIAGMDRFAEFQEMQPGTGVHGHYDLGNAGIGQDVTTVLARNFIVDHLVVEPINLFHQLQVTLFML